MLSVVFMRLLFFRLDLDDDRLSPNPDFVIQIYVLFLFTITTVCVYIVNVLDDDIVCSCLTL